MIKRLHRVSGRTYGHSRRISFSRRTSVFHTDMNIRDCALGTRQQRLIQACHSRVAVRRTARRAELSHLILLHFQRIHLALHDARFQRSMTN